MKELEIRINDSSMRSLTSLTSLSLGEYKAGGGMGGRDHEEEGGIQQKGEGGDDSQYEHDEHISNPTLRRIEADFSSPRRELRGEEPKPTQGLVGDLFSEIHVCEVCVLQYIVVCCLIIYSQTVKIANRT